MHCIYWVQSALNRCSAFRFEYKWNLKKKTQNINDALEKKEKENICSVKKKVNILWPGEKVT